RQLAQKSLRRVAYRPPSLTQGGPENLKAADAGKLMVWMLGISSASPDGQDALAQMYGPLAGSPTRARFKLDEFDRLYERALVLPDGPERAALFRQAQRIAVAYMP